MGFQLPTAQLVKIAWLLAINHMLDLFASEGSWVPRKNRPNADRRPSSYEERGAGDVRFRPADGSQPLGWNFRNLWVKPMETFALKVPPFFKKKWRNIHVAENDLVPSWPSMWWRTSEKKTTQFLQDIWFPRFWSAICFSSPFLFWLPLATESGSPWLLDLRPSMHGFIVQLPGVAVAQNARTVRKMQLRREGIFTFLFVVLVSVCILEI